MHRTELSMKQMASQCKVVIIEQPEPNGLRFRYECEGRSAGSIRGISSTPIHKTYPAIGITGYQGRALVVVSCVTANEPYRPHPHNLVGREGCKKGVCTLQIPPERMEVAFPNLGIQCVKKKGIRASLQVRQEIRVDPFRTGFRNSENFYDTNLNAVRLCFQVFLEYQGKFAIPLAPVVSEPIFDKKAISSLTVVKISDTMYPADGGDKDVIILCEKIAKEDIALRFFEEKDGQLVWEKIETVPPYHVHRQSAIWFKPPCYKTIDIAEPVEIFMQLLKPSNGATSDAVPVTFLPINRDLTTSKRKRQKIRRRIKSEEESQNGMPTFNNFEIQYNFNDKGNIDMTPPAAHLNIPYNSSSGAPSDLDVPLDLSNWMDIHKSSKLQEINLSSGELSNLSARLSDSLSLSRKL